MYDSLYEVMSKLPREPTINDLSDVHHRIYTISCSLEDWYSMSRTDFRDQVVDVCEKVKTSCGNGDNTRVGIIHRLLHPLYRVANFAYIYK